MAMTTLSERWSMEDAYSASEILQDWTSGTIDSLGTGLLGEGRCIVLPVNLLQIGTVGGGAAFSGHIRARYTQDDAYFMQVYTSGGTGPYLKITNEVITAHRSDGTLLGTASSNWPLGSIRQVTMIAQLVTAATGRIKVWLNGSVVINLTNVQTVPAAGSTTAQGLYINGLGRFDDIGYRYGSGVPDDTDAMLNRWLRLRFVGSTSGVTFDAWSIFGSGATKVAVTSENPVDTTNGIQGDVSPNHRQSFFMAAAPSNLGTVWGAQLGVQAIQNGGALVPAGINFNIDGTNVATFTVTLSGAYYRIFMPTFPPSGSPWTSTNFNAMEIRFTRTT